jgi:(1->4)-alpha-D-glucan 1-alpha-D-glucosylmutase
MHAELISTYRLQLNPGFGFEQAASLVPYLRRLGISHLYLPPILQASPGSEHGYDVGDPTRVNNELGGEQALLKLFEAVKAAGMGVVLDIVPNHLGAVSSTPWWWSVLKEGPSSPHANSFDIDWNPADQTMKGKVLLPVLGDHLAKVLDAGKITASRDKDGEWKLAYESQRFPVNLRGSDMLGTAQPDLKAVLDVQHYRLCRFSRASEDINYRRFFAVQSLAGLKIEDPAVYEATHRKILELCTSGPVDGVRVDHPDGLRDPAEYFRRLRTQLPDKWIVAEKILETGEVMPEWPVDGTTGYDFLQMVGGLWVDPAGEKEVTDFYSDFTGHVVPFGVLVRDKKRDILRSGFYGDLDRIVRLLRTVCNRRLLDFSNNELRRFLTEVISCFPVYRTYVQPSRAEVTTSDGDHLKAAIASARRSSSFEEGLPELLESILLTDAVTTAEEAEFIARFQQLTSPVMAKGVEDTALYCYDRLLALNEVGCDPTRFGISSEVFHTWNTDAHKRWPLRMLTTSTHDTKRSEDVRARLSVISELSEEWASRVKFWSAHNLPAWEGRTPDRNAEHLLYQTLAGAWPIEAERVQDYMLKACRESSRHTTWDAPDESYETRIRHFVDTVLHDDDFIYMLEEFLPTMIAAGWINSLSQTLLKMTAPGIPDIYQGCELWDNSLVDPDNRRPVDFARRAALLDELESGDLTVDEIMCRMDDGLPKLHVIRVTLALRRRHPLAFAPGPDGYYRPLLVTGGRLANVIAYRRGSDVAVVGQRFTVTCGADWQDTAIELGEGSWFNVFDGANYSGEVSARELFEKFPVALLERK